MRIISAEKAKEIAQNHLIDPYHIISSCAVIDKTPTVKITDVIPHGRWEEIKDPYGKIEGWLCECGREVKCKENYCPSCGAKMDLED